MGKNVVVVGTQWGDEGKGKIVDLLTAQLLEFGAAAHANHLSGLLFFHAGPYATYGLG